MSRWVALHCGEEAEELLARHPNAFLLLCQIAMRAKWKDCPVTKLRAGEAFIGDWKRAGLPSEKAYRHAKDILRSCGLVVFDGARKGAGKGTVATLTNSTIFSITAEEKGEQKGTLRADQGRARGEQGATNHPDTRNTQSTLSEPESLPEVPPSGRRFPDHSAIIAKINALRPEWSKPATWGPSELHHLHGALGQLEELKPEDWDLLKRYLSASLDQAKGYWQPNNRSKFAESFSDVMASATRWAEKSRPSQPFAKVAPALFPQRQNIPREVLAKALRLEPDPPDGQGRQPASEHHLTSAP